MQRPARSATMEPVAAAAPVARAVSGLDWNAIESMVKTILATGADASECWRLVLTGLDRKVLETVVYPEFLKKIQEMAEKNPSFKVGGWIEWLYRVDPGVGDGFVMSLRGQTLKGTLETHAPIKRLPERLTIEGHLVIGSDHLQRTPKNLTVRGNLELQGCIRFKSLGKGLSCRDLHLANCPEWDWEIRKEHRIEGRVFLDEFPEGIPCGQPWVRQGTRWGDLSKWREMESASEEAARLANRKLEAIRRMATRLESKLENPKTS